MTLIFALARYRAVMDAYLSGLEQAAAVGRDLAAIHSVASFFVSRVDSEVDARLDQIAASRATQLKGRAAIANARLAYQSYGEVITSQRWQKLAGLGAQPQRPLWASTGAGDSHAHRAQRLPGHHSFATSASSSLSTSGRDRPGPVVRHAPGGMSGGPICDSACRLLTLNPTVK